jgi:hypothetical protein
VPWPIMARQGPGPTAVGGQGFPFRVLELRSGLISRRNKEMTLDTKSWVDQAGSVPSDGTWSPGLLEQTHGHGSQTQYPGRVPGVMFGGQWGAWLLLYTVVMTVMTMSSCRISEAW